MTYVSTHLERSFTARHVCQACDISRPRFWMTPPPAVPHSNSCFLLPAFHHVACALEHRVGSGPDPVVFAEIAPDDSAVAIDEELGWTRDRLAADPGTLVDKVVGPDHVCRWIGQQRVRVTHLARELEGRRGIIDTDRDGLDTQPLEFGETALDTP